MEAERSLRLKKDVEKAARGWGRGRLREQMLRFKRKIISDVTERRDGDIKGGKSET